MLIFAWKGFPCLIGRIGVEIIEEFFDEILYGFPCLIGRIGVFCILGVLGVSR